MKNGAVTQGNMRGKKGTKRKKKWNKSEKDMVSTVLLPFATVSNFVSSL